MQRDFSRHGSVPVSSAIEPMFWRDHAGDGILPAHHTPRACAGSAARWSQISHVVLLWKCRPSAFLLAGKVLKDRFSSSRLVCWRADFTWTSYFQLDKLPPNRIGAASVPFGDHFLVVQKSTRSTDCSYGLAGSSGTLAQSSLTCKHQFYSGGRTDEICK